jgi:OOP family OmpA-OmpF porin
MKSRLAIALMLLFVPFAFAGTPPDEKDTPGCKDHALFTRMPGYWIRSCDDKEFDAHEFVTGTGKTTTVEGRLWRINYYPQNSLTTKPSELQIRRNFQNAVQKLGGTAVATDKGRDAYRIMRNGKEIWVEVWAEFTGKYGFFIVEKGGMEQDIVANASALSNDIRSTGHAAVYGILFDTGKWDIKPESAQAIGEVAKLLKTDPALKLYVVGHTDNVGGVEPNLKLSENRAEAVKQALVRDHGIAAPRLRAFGAAQFAPVASNDSEDGRTSNRRVELVKQ